MAVTVDDLTERAQRLYDVVGSDVLSDSDWMAIINDSYRKLYRTVVRINKYFRVSTDGPFTLTTTQTRALPSLYRETVMVRLNPGTDQQMILERMTPRIAANNWARSYRLQGTNLVIEPLSRCAGTYDHLYIPNVAELDDGIDAIDPELEQFAAFIVYDAVNVALAREESDRAYEVDFQREERDVIAWASSQRSADPDIVEDVRGGSWWWRRGVMP